MPRCAQCIQSQTLNNGTIEIEKFQSAKGCKQIEGQHGRNEAKYH